ncbi:MAG: LPS biosynthesis protein [Proteobacteria bacterium]|nr:MAG: LPS biosynthesis protein [Pseudomonadota bacterium]PIE67435.1 MAG: LPS biosynthesis protein [Deltaproteobacteria bacterium]
MAPERIVPLSVAIVARDEADRIGVCLDGLDFADEVVVVVDSRSRDRTLEIAASRGCHAVSRPWQGFSQQKQMAVDLARHDWVLILDADERVPAATAGHIARLVTESPTDAAAYSLLRKNFFHGRWIRRCGWWPDRVTRLVNRTRGRFSEHLVHEHWAADGPVMDLDAILTHHSFRNYADLVEKMQRYSNLSAMQIYADGRRVGWWAPPLHGSWTFIRNYLLELGIVEGLDGLVIALLNAGGSFFKYAKARELRRY